MMLIKLLPLWASVSSSVKWANLHSCPVLFVNPGLLQEGVRSGWPFRVPTGRLGAEGTYHRPWLPPCTWEPWQSLAALEKTQSRRWLVRNRNSQKTAAPSSLPA